MARQLRPVYTAVNEAEARARLEEFYDTWADRYPAIKNLWNNAWSQFVPFLDYSVEARRSMTTASARYTVGRTVPPLAGH